MIEWILTLPIVWKAVIVVLALIILVLLICLGIFIAGAKAIVRQKSEPPNYPHSWDR